MFAKRFNNISAVDGTGIECVVGRCQGEVVPWPVTVFELIERPARVVACDLRNVSAMFDAAPPDSYGLYYSKNQTDSSGTECKLFTDGLGVLWSDAECPPFLGSGWLPFGSPFLVRMVWFACVRS